MALAARGIQGGSDINVLVDAGSTGDMEVVKLGYSALGNETLIGADANGLDVDVTRTVSPTVSAVTETSVNDTASDTQLLASNSSRKYFSLFNDSIYTCYVRLSGSAASAAAYNFQMPPSSFYESPTVTYTGEVRAIWAADGSGAMRVSEG